MCEKRKALLKIDNGYHEAGRLVFFQFAHCHTVRLLQGKRKDRRSDLQIFISTRERAAWLLSHGVFILRFCLVVVVQKNAKHQLCFLTGGLDVQASIVVCRDRSVDLDHGCLLSGQKKSPAVFPQGLGLRVQPFFILFR